MADEDYADWLFGKYDKALVDWLNELRHLVKLSDGSWAWRHIPKCFATPDRAHAQIKKVLEKTIFYQTGRRKDIDTDIIPLPFMSISRTGVEFDQTRYVFPRVRYAALQMPDGTLTADPAILAQWVAGYFDASKIAQMNYPVPVDLIYQVEYWTRNAKHKDILDPQFWTRFSFASARRTAQTGRLVYLVINFGGIFGTKMIPMRLESVTDNSTLEAVSGENREMRRTYQFRLNGWIPNDPYLVTLVARELVEVWTADEGWVPEDYIGTVEIKE